MEIKYIDTNGAKVKILEDIFRRYGISPKKRRRSRTQEKGVPFYQHGIKIYEEGGKPPVFYLLESFWEDADYSQEAIYYLQKKIKKYAESRLSAEDLRSDLEGFIYQISELFKINI